MRILIAILFFATLFTSCYKTSYTELPPTINNTTTADSVYLSKELYVLKDNGGVLLDSIQTEFYFDSLKRVTRILYRNFLSNHVETRIFYYQGFSDKPYKDTFDNVGESSMTYYTYNAQKLIADSILTRTGASIDIISINNYTHVNNKIYVKSESRIIASQPNYSRFYNDTITLDGAGNIIANKHWIKGQTDLLIKSGNYTYSTKNSPYKMLNIKNLEGVFIFDTYFSPIANDFNNVNITYPNGAFNYNFTWSSIYNSKNYPTISNEMHLNNNDKATRTYTYIAL